MNNIKFTKEQQSVIDARDCSLLVSAAAGSGKTAVLVERIISLLLDPENPSSLDRLLVMTFTRAAAAGMKEKIRDALRNRCAALEAQLLSERPGSPEYEKTYTALTGLRSQEGLLPRARIATIDAVCQSLIRQYFQILGIDPAFRAADEAELRLMRGDLLKDLLEEKYAEGCPDFLHLSGAFTKTGFEGKLSDLISRVYDFACARPWPEEFLESCRTEAEEEKTGSVFRTAWFGRYAEELRDRAREQAALLRRTEDLCLEPDGWKPYLEILENLTGTWEALEAALASEPEQLWTAVRGQLTAYTKPRLTTKGCREGSPEKKAAAKAVIEQTRSRLEDLKAEFAPAEEEIRLASGGSAADIAALAELVLEFLRRFSEKKRLRGVVDFSDMEHLALRLLYRDEKGEKVPSPLADELAQELDGILIDEYQDSNEVQEALIRALSAERFGRPDVFMVGDVKQSIYSFRQAKPELFLQKYREYSPEETGNARKIELNRNFRSRPEILSCVNGVFREIMKPETGGILYDEAAELHADRTEQLPAGAEGPDPSVAELLSQAPAVSLTSGPDPYAAELLSQAPAVPLTSGPDPYAAELLLVEKEVPEEGELAGAEEPDPAEKPCCSEEELEAVMTALRIRELLGGKKPGPDGKGHGPGGEEPEPDGKKPGSGGEEPGPGREKSEPEPDGKETGPVFRKKDICILLRTSKKAELFVDVLARFGIDAVFDSATGYFASQEVGTVLAFLNIIDNPRQDIALVTALRSPVTGFTDEELSLIRVSCGKTRDGKLPEFYDALKQAAEDPAHPVNGRAAEFLTRLEQYRELSGHLPVHELISRLYTETGLYTYFSALPGGKKRRRNLDMLLEKAENYAATSYHGLFNFTRYIEQLRSYDTDYGEAGSASGNDDVVRVTTIHKSKGLEYPVTFVSDLAHRFNISDERERLVMDDALGIACDYIDTEKRICYPSLKASVIRKRMRRELAGEELRVFYVAMTRAQEKLILTGTVNGFAKKLEKELEKKGDAGSALSELQLLLRSGICGTPALITRITERGVLEQEGPETERTDSRAALQRLLETGRAPEDLRKLLQSCVNARYPFAGETRLKPKVSVSELKAKALEEQEFDFVRDLEERKEIKGAEYGTLVHRAFEILDYTKEGEEALPEITGTAPETMRSVRRVIETFRGTELGKRMKAAQEQGSLFREQHFMAGFPAAELDPETESEELQLMQGIIDAYILSPGGITLIDYKTDRVDSAEKLVSRYALQLELYARALEQLLRRPVREKLIYSTCLGQTIPV